MKITFFVHAWEYSGSPLLAAQLAAGLKARGHTVTVAGEPMRGSAPPLLVDLLTQGLKVVTLEHPGKYLEAINGADVVLANSVPTYSAIHQAAAWGIPTLFLLHEHLVGLHWLQQFGEIESAYRKATRVVHASFHTADLYNTRFPRQTQVIHYGVDLWPDTAIHSFSYPRMAVLGSLEQRKGQDIAIRVWDRLRPFYPELTLTLMGATRDEGFRSHLEQWSRKYPEVRVLPPVPPHQLRAWIAQHVDILLAPSLDEIIPQVGLYAMAQGKTVLFSNTGGVEDYVTCGYNGYVVGPYSEGGPVPKEIETNMVNLLHDKQLLVPRSVQARYIGMNARLTMSKRSFGDYVTDIERSLQEITT